MRDRRLIRHDQRQESAVIEPPHKAGRETFEDEMLWVGGPGRQASDLVGYEVVEDSVPFEKDCGFEQCTDCGGWTLGARLSGSPESV